MAECPKCGAEAPEGTKFCPSCGAPLEGSAAVPPAPVGGTAQEQQAPTPPPQPPMGVAPPPRPGPPAREPKKGMARGAKIAIILSISAVVLIILALVLFFVFFANVITGPADVANEYVSSLNDGDLTTAWSYLASETQEEEGRSGFEEKVGLLKGQIDRWYTTSVNVESGGRAQVVMDLTLDDGEEATWDMYLLKESGKWKIRLIEPRT